MEDASRFDLAEPIPGPTSEALAKVARETGMVVVGSLFERRTAGIYHNTAVVLDVDGSIRGRYRKMHIPDDPLYYEKRYFTPGDLGFQTFETKAARVGTLGLLGPVVVLEAARVDRACKAARSSSTPRRSAGTRPRRPSSAKPRPTPGKPSSGAHAINNGPVLLRPVNRVGHEGPADGGLEFWGDRSWPTRSVECSPARAVTPRKSSWWPATPP